MEVLLSLVLFFSLLNLILIFSIGLFLVRFKDRVDGIFKDIFEAMSVMYGAIPETLPSVEVQPKTWDEKYEEELEVFAKRMREGSGLRDLPEPGVSWGSPPAPNLANSEGLIVKDI